MSHRTAGSEQAILKVKEQINQLHFWLCFQGINHIFGEGRPQCLVFPVLLQNTDTRLHFRMEEEEIQEENCHRLFHIIPSFVGHGWVEKTE